MTKLLTLLGLIPTTLFGQSTTPTERAVLSAGTAITRLPATATTTVSATDTVLVFKGGLWYKTTTNALVAKDSLSTALGRGMGTGLHDINFTNNHGLYYYRSADIFGQITFHNAGPNIALVMQCENDISGALSEIGVGTNSCGLSSTLSNQGIANISLSGGGLTLTANNSGLTKPKNLKLDSVGFCLADNVTEPTAMLDVRGSMHVIGDSISLVSNNGINIYASDSLALTGNKITLDGVLNLTLSGSDSIHIASTVTRVRGGDFNIYDGGLNVPDTINTSAGTTLTQNCIAGSFRKNNSGSTFTVTNTFAKSTSIILLTPQSALTATGYNVAVTTKNNGSFVVTFYTAGAAAAPASNFDIGYLIINKLN